MIKKIDFNLFMFICVCFYIALKFTYRPVGDVFQTIIILLSIPTIYIYRKEIIKDPLFWIFSSLIIIPIISWINSLYAIPELAKEKPNAFIFINLFWFVFSAIWLKGSKYRMNIFILTYCFGFLLACYLKSDNFIQELLQGLNGIRVDFNVHNAQHTGMMSGIGFIASLYVCISNVSDAFNKKSHKTTWLIILLSIISIISMLTIAIISQSRQVWLATLVALALSPIYYIIIHKKISFKVLLPLIIILISSVLLAAQSKIIEKRSEAESNVITSALSGNISNIPFDSAGTRLNFWLEAEKWFVKNPILGTGEDTRALVISEAESFPEWVKKQYWHLHNSLIEILVSYGLLGFIATMALYFWLYRSIPNRNELLNIKLLAIIMITYWLVVNNFESYFFWKTGEVVNTFILTCIYTYYLSSREKKESCS